MPSDEARRLLKVFGVAVTSLEDAVEGGGSTEDVARWDREAAERLREVTAFVEGLRRRRTG